ncbi:trehalase domain-containing protein [Tautonia plasticadhaerens]|uniref:Glucosidase n=1 Tax=Tautonia plasticadhaerens TaxID=2527974 RepID=A0A518HEX4_9BACT|nr:hypothetical protein [Tautonia plasticadhaerens]QDV39407.1 hypothetical protein ElP_73740 [Tautonia plasticadhaerens]
MPPGNVDDGRAGAGGTTAEHRRLTDGAARRADWKHWGPYVAERAWGTVCEDYSPSGDAWASFPHDHARSRAYRWNEDGLAGFFNRFQNLCLMTRPGVEGRLLLAAADRVKLERVLPRMLDPGQFLSDFGLRSMSRGLAAEPYECHGRVVGYEPAGSTTPIYGGNSNRRGPVWFPLNFLMIEALREYHRYFGDSLRAELPRGSARPASLGAVADELSGRLVRLFLRDEGRGGHRPVFGDVDPFRADPAWSDLVPFHEYFHGEHGAGLGASHQTGWTALVTELFGRPGGHSPSGPRDRAPS